MLSGECRVETTPAAGCEVFLEGMRLHLDLRLVPRASTRAADGRVETLLEVEHARFSATRGLSPSFERAAIYAGLGALTLAVIVWCLGGTSAPSPLDAAAPARVSAPTNTRAVPRSSAASGAHDTPVASRTPGAPSAPRPAPDISPAPADLPPAGARRAAPLTPPRPAPEVMPTPGASTPKSAPVRAKAAMTTQPTGSRNGAPAAPARARASVDKLDLFEDTK
jgi:hypothetical protein